MAREGGFDLDSSDSSSRLSHTHSHQPTVTFLSSILKLCSTLFLAVSGMLSAKILTNITSDRSYWSWSSRFPQMLVLVALVLVRGPLLLLQYWASPARRGRRDPTRFYSDTIPSNSNHPVHVRLLIHFVVIAFQISYQSYASRPPTRTI